MSFIIAVHVGEGIVLAGDSRTTYTITHANGSRDIGVHATNATEKLFLCPNGCGIATCGDASIGGRPITSTIQSFIREKIHERTYIVDVPHLIIEYFRQFQPVPNTNFIIVGYHKEAEKIYQKVYQVKMGNQAFEEFPTQHQGAIWDGETITLTKLIQPVALKKPDGTYDDLPNYEIFWNFFTLHDAVDFARFAVETTINTMHFQNAIKTVGKPIDILVIQPEESYWLNKKELA